MTEQNQHSEPTEREYLEGLRYEDKFSEQGLLDLARQAPTTVYKLADGTRLGSNDTLLRSDFDELAAGYLRLFEQLEAQAEAFERQEVRRLEDAKFYNGKITEVADKHNRLLEQLESAHRNMDRYGMALAVIADGGYGDASMKARAALNPASMHAAPGVRPAPTKSGAVPTGNDGETGAA